MDEIREVLTTMATAPPDLVGALLAILRPTEADLRAAFVGPVRRAPRALPPIVVPGVARTILHLADAGSLARPRRGFDGRYLRVAPWLRPGPVWAAFTYLDAADRPLATFDGLVLRPGRWCWIHQPWDVIGMDVAAHDHWID